ncbi:transcription cofactor vestigial-like protein 3 [Polypterus senegalus]|uniref:transcription cofactor vestigial-like protein 3 n=1 Tax=Polypterus senegalus TaxID=55291 RepID=UPI001963A13E|nr:transcription cofactor vestigial-like protein 3 [Polypterus senegalus]
MSCLDVLCGARQGLPPSVPAGFKEQYGQLGRQRGTRMLEAEDAKDKQETEAETEEAAKEPEYLNSRCVLFTYFQGDIGDVVDEHFTRALSQTSDCRAELKCSKTWRDSSPVPSSQCTTFPASFWSSSYQPQVAPCIAGVHTDFPAASTTPAVAFHNSDPLGWGHSLQQPSLANPATFTDSWHYQLASQASPSYPHVHDVYSHLHHHHHQHPHHLLHHSHSSHLDPRYSSLLVPAMRAAHSRNSTTTCDMTKGDGTSTSQPWTGTFQGMVDISFDAAFTHPDAGKGAGWF